MPRNFRSPGYIGFQIFRDELEVDGITICAEFSIEFDAHGGIEDIFLTGSKRAPVWFADAVASWAKSPIGERIIEDAREEARWEDA